LFPAAIIANDGALAAGLTRQDHMWMTAEQLVRFYKKTIR